MILYSQEVIHVIQECVICATVYVTDISEGWQRLVPAPVTMGSGSSSGAGNPMSSAPRTSVSHDKGKAVMGSMPLQVNKHFSSNVISQLTYIVVLAITSCIRVVTGTRLLNSSVVN
jgi:hypothetical protein